MLLQSCRSILVTVPPRWVVEPIDVNVERNRHVTLHCQAQGVPTPVVSWKKATGMGYIILSMTVEHNAQRSLFMNNISFVSMCISLYLSSGTIGWIML